MDREICLQYLKVNDCALQDSDAMSGGGGSLGIPCNHPKKSLGLGPRTFSTVSAPCSHPSSSDDDNDDEESINTLTIQVPKLQNKLRKQNSYSSPTKQQPPQRTTATTRSLKNNKYLSVPFK